MVFYVLVHTIFSLYLKYFASCVIRAYLIDGKNCRYFLLSLLADLFFVGNLKVAAVTITHRPTDRVYWAMPESAYASVYSHTHAHSYTQWLIKSAFTIRYMNIRLSIDVGDIVFIWSEPYILILTEATYWGLVDSTLFSSDWVKLIARY